MPAFELHSSRTGQLTPRRPGKFWSCWHLQGQRVVAAFNAASRPMRQLEAVQPRGKSYYGLTAPAVMPSMKRRCNSTKANMTGNTMITAAASISPQAIVTFAVVMPNRFSNSATLTTLRGGCRRQSCGRRPMPRPEEDALVLNPGDAGNGANGAADRRCREMTDVDCHSDADICR